MNKRSLKINLNIDKKKTKKNVPGGPYSNIPLFLPQPTGNKFECKEGSCKMLKMSLRMLSKYEIIKKLIIEET